MPGLAILPSQKNEIHGLLTEKGFSPTEFLWEEGQVPGDNGCLPVKLIHQPTGFFCRFSAERSGSGKPYTQIEYSPSEEGFIKRESVSGAYAWSLVLMRWVDILRKEIDTPDLWDSLEGGNQLLQDATEQSSDNLPFTQAELPQVRSALEEIKTYVLKIKELTESQIRIVDARFDHMEEAATRMGRKDWLSLVIGNLMGVAFTLALNGDSARDLFGFAALVIKRVLGTMLYLAGPR